MQNDLNDRVILITGAARGLGLAYARYLLAQGAQLALHDGGVGQDGATADDRVITDSVAQLLAGTGTDPARVLALPGLLDGWPSCQRLVARTLDHFGRIDGLIHNAGVVIWGDPVEMTPDAYAANARVNHDAAFWLVKAALPAMRRQRYGRILLTSSGWARRPDPGAGRLAAYIMSKSAQYGLGQAMALAAGHPDIRTNVILPVAKTRVYVNEVAPGTLTPEQVAPVAAWLVSPACARSGLAVSASDGQITLNRWVQSGSARLPDGADPDTAGEVIEGLAAGFHDAD